MKQIVVFLFIISFLNISLPAQITNDKAIIGYLFDGMNDIRSKDAQVAFSIWVKELSLSEKLDVKVKYYETDKEIVKDYKNKKFKLLILNPLFYLQHQANINPITKEYWLTQRSHKKYERMVLLVKKNSGIKGIDDLKGKTVAIKDDNYVGKLFLEKEILQNSHIVSREYIKEFVNTKKHSTAILKTFFSKVDACIVPEYTLDLIGEMNPAVTSSLITISHTPHIYTAAIIMFHTDTEDAMITAFRRNTSKLDQSVRGQNILDLFKMKGLFQIDSKELQPLKNYYEEYLSLLNKYGTVREY